MSDNFNNCYKNYKSNSSDPKIQMLLKSLFHFYKFPFMRYFVNLTNRFIRNNIAGFAHKIYTNFSIFYT